MKDGDYRKAMREVLNRVQGRTRAAWTGFEGAFRKAGFKTVLEDWIQTPEVSGP